MTLLSVLFPQTAPEPVGARKVILCPQEHSRRKRTFSSEEERVEARRERARKWREEQRKGKR